MNKLIKKAIVVGATSGIGKELCRVLLKNNYQLGIAAPEENLLEEMKAGNPHNIKVICFDAIKEDCSKNLNELVSVLGGLDLLVFCAGIGHLNRNLGFEAENKANELNVLAFTEIADWSYRFFEAQGHGHFASISSIAGLFGYRKAPAYHAAKSYQISYMEGLRQKAHQSDKPIYVTDIRPGYVDTEMGIGKKQFWVLTKEEAATQIYKLIKKKKAVGYLSHRWRFIASLVKILPRALRKRM